MPFILQLYACSQPAMFESIEVGNILVGARMLLKIQAQDSKHRRHCFVTSTRETRLYVLKKPSDAINRPFSGSDVLDRAVKWRQSLEAKQLLRDSYSGGYYHFPPLTDSLESYKRTFSPEKPMDLITTVNLGFVLREIHYRERVRLHVQAIVVALEFVPFASNEISSTETPGESGRSQLSEHHVADEKVRSSTSPLLRNQSSEKAYFLYHFGLQTKILPRYFTTKPSSETRGQSVVMRRRNRDQNCVVTKALLVNFCQFRYSFGISSSGLVCQPLGISEDAMKICSIIPLERCKTANCQSVAWFLCYPRFSNFGK